MLLLQKCWLSGVDQCKVLFWKACFTNLVSHLANGWKQLPLTPISQQTATQRYIIYEEAYPKAFTYCIYGITLSYEIQKHTVAWNSTVFPNASSSNQRISWRQTAIKCCFCLNCLWELDSFHLFLFGYWLFVMNFVIHPTKPNSTVSLRYHICFYLFLCS